MNKKYYIVSGSPHFDLCCEIGDSDIVIACDAGYDHCRNHNIVPDLILGDFDSSKSKMEDLNIPVLFFPQEKDDTDTGLAMKYALNQKAEEIIILGGTGGRMDHFIANLSLLALGAESGAKCSMLDSGNKIHMLCGGNNADQIRIPKEEGWSISLLSFSQECTGVNSTGLKYPLRGTTLKNYFPLGVSNAFQGDYAEINLKTGLLLVVLSRIE